MLVINVKAESYIRELNGRVRVQSSTITYLPDSNVTKEPEALSREHRTCRFSNGCARVEEKFTDTAEW